jgi:calcineurin-like phosphoesterase family protein
MIGEKLILSHEPVDIPWAFNLHGHVHSLPHGQKSHHRHFNCCSDAIGYKPINLNQWLKQGYLANIQTIHRETIDRATERKAKRGGKKLCQ